MKLHDINDVKLAAKYGESRFWFSPETMRFFASRVGHKAWTDGEGGAYFVTSERAWGEGPRLYSVRYRTPEGRISTVGTFQGFASGGRSRRSRGAVRHHARLGRRGDRAVSAFKKGRAVTIAEKPVHAALADAMLRGRVYGWTLGAEKGSVVVFRDRTEADAYLLTVREPWWWPTSFTTHRARIARAHAAATTNPPEPITLAEAARRWCGAPSPKVKRAGKAELAKALAAVLAAHPVDSVDPAIVAARAVLAAA